MSNPETVYRRHASSEGSIADPQDEPLAARLRCLRWDAEGDRRLAAMSPACWTMLAATLEERAGLSLLARRVQRAGIKPPADVAQKLRANGLVLAVRNLQSRIALADTIKATNSPALLLKGVDLADRLYGNPAHRPMGDVDFLVHGQDAMAYHHHLLAKGFSARNAPDAATRSASWQRHVYYVAPPGGAALPFELHWRLANEKGSRFVDLAGIWARSLPHAEFGPLARVMSPEDLFVYLCLHLKDHVFEGPLTNLWDIAEMLECPRLPLDWDILWQRAREWRLVETVRITLHMVTRTLGVPTRHLSEWSPDASLETLFPDGLLLLGQHSDSMSHAGARLGQVLSSKTRWRDRLTALAQGLVPSRLEIRLRYGRVDQNAWDDIRSYLRRWRSIGVMKAGVLSSWLRRDSDMRPRIDRITRLKAHLDDHAEIGDTNRPS